MANGINIVVADSWDLQSEEKTLYGQVDDAMIGGLRPAVIYQVRVFAENELGRSKEGRVLQVIHQSSQCPQFDHYERDLSLPTSHLS